MKTITFDCNGRFAPAYSCSEPDDNSGEYVRASVAQALYDATERLIEESKFMRDEYSDMNEAVIAAEQAMSAADGEPR